MNSENSYSVCRWQVAVRVTPYSGDPEESKKNFVCNKTGIFITVLTKAHHTLPFSARCIK
jgi:hypothetical protein